jgi:phosphoribosylanthranilate isomerase
MKLKVCGITKYDQLLQLDHLGVDFAGLIFYERSKRFVGDKLKNEAPDIKRLPIKKVGVFVNAGTEAIKKAVDDYDLAFAQLHGDESPDFCKQVNNLVPVIKAIRIGTAPNIEEQLLQYSDACTYFLFDTDSKEYGGTGKKFSWHVLQNKNIPKPFFLSGGIGLEDIVELKAFDHPQLFAIDVNSRFETEAGVKDMEKVKELINILK